SIGYLLKSINDKLKIRADEDMQRFNLTFQQSRILAFLNERSGSASQKEIEIFLEVSHPTVVGLVSRMEQKGFVTSAFDPQDKRNKIITLTQVAVDTSKEMEQMIDMNEQKMLRTLSEAEIATLEKVLAVIYRNLE
ncbi:MAG: MarR family winged helix-turn-helix transcriptional regulator, partial [Candidatus Fimenecus sp.]